MWEGQRTNPVMIALLVILVHYGANQSGRMFMAFLKNIRFRTPLSCAIRPGVAQGGTSRLNEFLDASEPCGGRQRALRAVVVLPAGVQVNEDQQP